MHKFDHPIALVYCKDNQAIASHIEADLASIIEFTHFSCGKDEQTSITELVQGFEGPILMLLSDNFLRNKQCMQQGLMMLNEHEDNLFPIIIPGYKINDDEKEEVVLTDFSRFKQVVQYINFWQDRYLELRQQKRNDPDLDNEGFANYLHTIRDIAGEAGQYLRTLQTMDLLSQDDAFANSYEAIFDFIEATELWEEFRTKGNETVEDKAIDEEFVLPNIPGLELLEDVQGTSIEQEEFVEPPTSDPVTEETLEEEVSSPSTIKEDLTPIVANAWELNNKGDYDLAVKELVTTIESYPNEVSLHYNLAVLHTQNENYSLAEKEVSSLLELSQEDDVLFLAGELADLQGQTQKALSYFKNLAKNNDDYPNIYYILGLLTQTDTPEETTQIETYFNTAVLKNKKSSFACYELALLYLKNDDDENAKKYLKRTIKLDNNHSFAHYDLALLLHKNSSFKKAQKHYHKAIEINPDLQTGQNDIAFSINGKIADKEDTIKALKDKIKALEALLEAKA